MIAQQSWIEIVGSYASGEDAVKELASVGCDVCILDLSLPGISGMAVVQELKQVQPETRCLILTMHPEHVYGLRCMTDGAAGYLTKGHRCEDLLDAIRTIASGRRHLTSEMTGILADHMFDGVLRMPHDSLSQREFQVFTMLASGDSATEIGDALFISVKTVSTYRARVLAKLGITRNAQLTSYAITHGLITSEPSREDIDIREFRLDMNIVASVAPVLP
jgi:DNA-binding NarL/FixJ family response regulator